MIGAALAAWIAFAPCGYDVMASEGAYGFAEAPNLARIWVRADRPGSILVPVTRPGSPPCVYIRGPGGSALVLGSERDVLCKLDPKRSECTEHDEPNVSGP